MRGKVLRVFLMFVFIVLFTGTALAAKHKVILDSDMVELFDDGVAMLMLASHPEIELLGVTIVGGNGWLQAGIARGIRQLELIGRTDIPVVAGARLPTRVGRYEAVTTPREGDPTWWGYERQLFGIGVSSYTGSFGSPEPKGNTGDPVEGWRTYYLNRYGTNPTLDILPDERPAFKYKNASDFIVEQVNENPGEVTIVAIGPCTNLMMAVMKDPTFASKVKQVIYMGGAVNVSGNTTPAAEFNWWWDPEAARFAVRTPWGKALSTPNEDKITQIVVPLDVCEKIHFTHKQYDTIVNLPGINSGIKTMFVNNYGARYADSSSTASSYVWDAITAAILIGQISGNDIVLQPNEANDHLNNSGYMDWWLDVNSDYSIDYGRSTGFARQGPVGTQKVRIINTVDEKKFWDTLYIGLDPNYVPKDPEPPEEEYEGCSAFPFGFFGLLALIIVPVLSKKR